MNVTQWPDFSDDGYATLSAVVSVLSHYIEMQDDRFAGESIWDSDSEENLNAEEALLEQARAIYDAWEGAGS